MKSVGKQIKIDGIKKKIGDINTAIYCTPRHYQKQETCLNLLRKKII